MRVWIFRVSEQYIRRDLTFELKTLSLVFVEMTVDFQTGQRMAKACLASLVLSAMSSSVPADWLILLPRYTYSPTSSTDAP